ncbi:MAG: CARDB domain-containing protein, partial [Candidatus Poseidoniaceae archaeon]
NWFGSSTIEVFEGKINTTISMPSTGGLMDFQIAFLDPWETRTIGGIELPLFIVDGQAPIILDSSIDELSRYHLDDVGIGVNIDEDVSWTGLLNLTCRVSSTELTWDPITISLEPSNVFQGKTLFSFNFDFSDQGDPSLLSPEAQLDCWAAGYDDSGWPLSFTTELADNQPWISTPLSTVGPNIELLDVKLEGKIEAGKELRAEITVKNSGESLQESFNISVYTIVGDEKTLVGLYSQSQIASGQGVVKRVAITVPDGDWEILVVVDEEQRIWELNEDDNTFTKSYSAPDEVSSLIYILGGGGILAVLLLFVILRKRSGNELNESKKLPSIEDLPRSGPPQSSRSSSQTQTPTKPKRGPPPKQTQPEPTPVVTNVADAMAKLSLDSLPGREVKSETTVQSYESLPSGGDYEYLTEGTFYTGSGIGRWKLEEDGTFTKIE